MRKGEQSRVVAGLLSLGFVLTACADTDSEKEEEAPKPQKPIAFLDIKNSGEGSYPGGATPKKGTWKVHKASNTLRVAVEPLVVSWIEFGPEIREKGSTILATASAPGEGRLQSRFGAGLYGKNGFQLRLQPVRDEVELVRRGAVLAKVDLEIEPGASYEMELSVEAGEADDSWIVKGRAWPTEGERPEKEMMVHETTSEELEFPLAGRPCLVATPFSGEPVAYSRAEVFDGVYESPAEETEEDASGEKDGEGSGEKAAEPDEE